MYKAMSHNDVRCFLLHQGNKSRRFPSTAGAPSVHKLPIIFFNRTFAWQRKCLPFAICLWSPWFLKVDYKLNFSNCIDVHVSNIYKMLGTLRDICGFTICILNGINVAFSSSITSPEGGCLIEINKGVKFTQLWTQGSSLLQK